MEKVSAQSVPDLRDYGRTLWRHRVMIIVTLIVAVVAAVVLSASLAHIYEATTQLIIQRTSALDSSRNSPDAARTVDAETAVLRSNAVKDAARTQLGHSFHVRISSTNTSDIVEVTARSTDAERAAEDANGYATAYVNYRLTQISDQVTLASNQIRAKITVIDDSVIGLPTNSPQMAAAQQRRASLQDELDQLQLSGNLNRPGQAQILTAADTPKTPVSPKPVRNAAIALVLGLLLGVCLAFGREFVDDSILSMADLERATGGLPVLGEIPKVREWRNREDPYVVMLAAPHSPAAESYRTLRTALQFLAVDRHFRTLQVTSAQPGDGKSTTAVNLAVAFARAGRRVIVVSCDLRKPRTHEFFGLSNEVGLTSLFLDSAMSETAIQPVRDEPNLAVLSSGPPPPNPSELLSSSRAGELIDWVSQSCDLVLVDTPPVLAVSDALIVSSLVDATLLVASAKASSRRSVQRSVEMLRQVNAPLIGTVLNRAESIEGYNSYGYGYIDAGSKATPID